MGLSNYIFLIFIVILLFCSFLVFFFFWALGRWTLKLNFPILVHFAYFQNKNIKELILHIKFKLIINSNDHKSSRHWHILEIVITNKKSRKKKLQLQVQKWNFFSNYIALDFNCTSTQWYLPVCLSNYFRESWRE